MKTTLEIPDDIFHRAKAKAAERRIPLRQFVSEAVAEKLQEKSSSREEARSRLTGKLKHLRMEAEWLDKLIEKEFERIDPEEWS